MDTNTLLGIILMLVLILLVVDGIILYYTFNKPVPRADVSVDRLESALYNLFKSSTGIQLMKNLMVDSTVDGNHKFYGEMVTASNHLKDEKTVEKGTK